MLDKHFWREQEEHWNRRVLWWLAQKAFWERRSEREHAELCEQTRLECVERAAECKQHAATALKGEKKGTTDDLADLVQKEMNQCDGCRRGILVSENGVHRDGSYLIMCTANRYRKQS